MEELFLVLPGTPAAVDDELDAVDCGIRCRPAQGTEERWIEVGDTGNLVVEDRRAVGDGTVSLASTAPRCSLRGTSMGDAAVEDEDASDW